uniref:Bm11228 n=1 Tax=Brugia malayi TaxID=6279 RepID=A0A0J9YD87_BRUMA|nr:Bm11228 [Brugia malayi]
MYVDRVMEGDLMTWKTVLTGPAVERSALPQGRANDCDNITGKDDQEEETVLDAHLFRHQMMHLYFC